MKVYTISDDQMNGYCGPLFEASSDQEALVSIRNMVLRPENDVVRMLLPYQSLICVGEFDRSSGVFSPEKRIVISLSSLSLEVKDADSKAL